MKITRLEDLDPHAFTQAVVACLRENTAEPILPEIEAIIVATSPAALLDFCFDHCGTPFFEMPIGGEMVRFADTRVFDGRAAGRA